MTEVAAPTGSVGSDTSEGMSYLETLPRRLVTLYLPLGIILIVLGAYFLLTNLGVLANIRWDLFWPAVLIALGLLLLLRRR